MGNAATLSWKGEEVGKVSNITSDMWYLEGYWQPNNSEQGSTFAERATNLKADDVIKSPFKGLVAVLKYDESPSLSTKVLVLSLDTSKIFMRIISDEVAAYAELALLPPWQPTDAPLLYEMRLREQITFFHPLNWKKVKAIGIRSDHEDVLFEVLNGSSKYAVVHLNHSQKRTRKYPVTQFYKDWEDLYKNRLLEDHMKWKEA